MFRYQVRCSFRAHHDDYSMATDAITVYVSASSKSEAVGAAIEAVYYRRRGECTSHVNVLSIRELA